MPPPSPFLLRRLVVTLLPLIGFLLLCGLLGLLTGSSGLGITAAWRELLGSADSDSPLAAIIWGLRLPRVLLAALVGAALSMGGLVFQALLRNPLAEPYILGISGGSAIGAITGIMIGLSPFPGICLTSFGGSMLSLAVIMAMASGDNMIQRNALLLSGVMVNAFCSAVIMFFISMTRDDRLHNILFWLMGDLSLIDLDRVGWLAVMLIPCFGILFLLSNHMNLLLMGRAMAQSMGINIRLTGLSLVLLTSFMVSLTVSHCGLIAFVGLVIPHIFRLLLGPDHRLLTPACILGGGGYMILCDLLARVLPRQGEMPIGVVTAMIGAPLFIILLKRSGP